eukprot:COSAG05_NODE_1151_length_5713_cov_19.933915_6_plen_52_part_00
MRLADHLCRVPRGGGALILRLVLAGIVYANDTIGARCEDEREDPCEDPFVS